LSTLLPLPTLNKPFGLPFEDGDSRVSDAPAFWVRSGGTGSQLPYSARREAYDR